MKTVNRMFDNTLNAISNRHLTRGRGMPLRITALALCSALLLPGIAMAKKPVKNLVEVPVEDPAGCVIFPSDIYTGYPFTVKIVRNPSYTGSWVSPTVDVTAVFAKTGGGESTTTSSDSIAKYGVTYVNATLLAPSCNNSDPCEIDTSVDAVITAVVKEPLNNGNKFRETVCTPVTATVNMSN
jgi:hypothetical protein